MNVWILLILNVIIKVLVVGLIIKNLFFKGMYCIRFVFLVLFFIFILGNWIGKLILFEKGVLWKEFGLLKLKEFSVFWIWGNVVFFELFIW